MTEKNPPCAFCGKKLHRRMDDGVAKKSDSWAWCRNQACAKYNLAQAETRFKSIPQVKLEPVPVVGVDEDFLNQQMEKAIAESLKGLLPEKPVEESPIVADTRTRVKAALVSLEKAYGRNLLGLAVAIVAQELGATELFNDAITEFKLDEIYQLKKVKK